MPPQEDRSNATPIAVTAVFIFFVFIISVLLVCRRASRIGYGLVSTTMKKGDVGELTILTSVAQTRWRLMPAR